MLAAIIKKIQLILETKKKNTFKYECIKICLMYIISGFIWIYFSDKIIKKFVNDKEMLIIISTYKGWLYVIITAPILYLIIRSILKKVYLAEKKLNKSYEELLAVNEKLESYVKRLTNSKEELKIQYDQTIESEKKLSKSEERYKALVSEMQQGLVLFQGSDNEEGKVINYKLLDSNASYERLTGLKKEDILSKTLYEIFPNMEKNLIEKIQRVAITGQSVHYQRYIKEKDKYYEAIVYRPKKLQFAAILTDITERKFAEKALKTSEYNFRNIFESSSDPILITLDNKVIDCNLAMIELLGYDSKSSILHKNPVQFSPEKQPNGESSKEKAIQVYKITMKNKKYKFEWWFKRVDGTLLPVEVMMTTILHNGKKVFHSLCRDIRERKEMENKLEYLSYHDQLTGLYNRRFFENELKRLDVEENLPLTIVMADVNGLKLVNDSFGHAAGDELLKKSIRNYKKGM